MFPGSARYASSARRPARWFRWLAETIFSRTLIPSVIPDQASHCHEHRHDRPGRDSCDYDKEQKLGDIVPTRFCPKEFAAYFSERPQFFVRRNGSRTRLGVAGPLKGVIR